MNKILDKVNITIVIIIIVISIIIVSSNFKKAIQYKSYLYIDSSNRDYIEKIVSENYKLTGTLDKIAYMGGLGDWYLFLYYEDGIEDETLFRDSDRNVQPLKEYIIKNGYNEGEESWNKIEVSFYISCVAIIYEIAYVIIRKRKNKNYIEK